MEAYSSKLAQRTNKSTTSSSVAPSDVELGVLHPNALKGVLHTDDEGRPLTGRNLEATTAQQTEEVSESNSDDADVTSHLTASTSSALYPSSYWSVSPSIPTSWNLNHHRSGVIQRFTYLLNTLRFGSRTGVDASVSVDSTTPPPANSSSPPLCRACDDDDPSHDCGCTALSTVFCGGQGRVGNMVVFKERTGRVGGEETKELLCLVGPFWPMLVCITYPLIIGISSFVYWKISPILPPLALIGWFLITMIVPVSLYFTGCRDPGILPRHEVQPDSSWRWNDQAKTYRPPRAYYDDECGVVIEEFDHTCPWTGTGIGKKNMSAFKVFVTSVCGVIVMDIVLTSGAMTVGTAD